MPPDASAANPANEAPAAPALTRRQLDSYREAGYLLLPGLLAAEQVRRFSQRFVDLIDGAAPVPGEMVVMRDVMVVKNVVQPPTPLHGINKILNFQTDAVLWGYACLDAIAAPARQLLGETLGADLHVISSNVFNKPPGVDARHPLHQDLRYFRLRPATGIVGVWTALSPCTRESGCLAVVPGSHRSDLREHGAPDWEHVNYGFYGVAGAPLGERVHVEMQPGDTLFFHPLLIHGSGSNRSADFRRAISVHYASARCKTPGRDWKTGPHVRAVHSPSAA